jgi:hypothetical protein
MARIGLGPGFLDAVVVLLLLLGVVRIVDDTIIHRMRHGLLFAVRIIIIDGILLLFDVSPSSRSRNSTLPGKKLAISRTILGS